MRKTTISILLSATLLAGCGEPALDGAQLAEEKGCIACHGLQGESLAPIYPKLNGQWEKYLRLQLYAYRDGKRDNAIMNGMAATLSDDEIRALAAHYGI